MGISPTLLVFVPYVMPVPVAVPVAAPAQGPRTTHQRERRAPVGTLGLEIQPGDVLQVYVDGYYAGTTAELGTAIELEAGQHDIELRAADYEPLAFGVRILADRVTTYRDTLKRAPRPQNDLAAGATSPPPAAVPMPLYVIPGCYAGNTPPSQS